MEQQLLTDTSEITTPFHFIRTSLLFKIIAGLSHYFSRIAYNGMAFSLLSFKVFHKNDIQFEQVHYSSQ
jgi:hypothetical protein